MEIAQGVAGEPALLLVDDVTDTLGMRETDELTVLSALAGGRVADGHLDERLRRASDVVVRSDHDARRGLT